MALADLFRTALRNVAANKMRALLTMLGVVIGVASVIAMLALGNGARAAVDASFQFLGANQIQIGQRYAMQGGDFKPMGKILSYEDGLGLMDASPLIERVDMSANRNVRARYGRSAIDISAAGSTAQTLDAVVSEGALQPVGWKAGKPFTATDMIDEGRFFTPEEVTTGAPVCVLGSQTAFDLFSGDNPINEIIWVDRIRCTVIGVLKELETTNIEDRYRSDPNILLMMPISAMITWLYEDEPSVYLVAHVSDINKIDEAKEQISAFLRERHAIEQDEEGKFQDDFDLTTRKDILGQQQEAARTFSLLLAAMSAVSLIVGGIGIMNVMLVSVTERTREIGVRMAVGAKARDIVNQFLLEAIFISASGGLAGIALGILAIPLAASLNQGMALLLPESIPMALGVALLTGVIFGLYPALRAARLSPMEALRYE